MSDRSSKKILVVEDEKPMARALVAKLSRVGYTAKAVFNGEEALTELEAGDYNLMFLDILMPKLDGWGVLEKAKSKSPDIKIVITSNLGQSEDIEKATKLGADGFMVKSDVSLEEIVLKADTILLV